MKIKFGVYIFILFLSSCSPFGNSSLIETITSNLDTIFNNSATPVKTMPGGGQIVSNTEGYRANVGISNASARLKTTCNSHGYCVEIAVSK